MASSTRVVVVAVAFTVVATFYSLSELHRMSAMHAQAETAKFATHTSTEGRSLVAGTTQAAAKTNVGTVGAQTGGVAANTAATTQATSTVAATNTAATNTVQHQSVKITDHKCYTYEHTELWGDVVVWGTLNKVKTAGDCCQSCLNYKPTTPEDPDCNVWVFCGDEQKCGSQYQQCWLKHLVHPEASKPARQGPTTAWTSGTIDVDINADPSADAAAQVKNGPPRVFHTVTSAQGAAVHWQVRIHYYWWKKRKAECEKQGGCEMGGFTRLLHSGNSDDLMDELPTVVVDPLPQSMVEHSWYVVLNRPYAFVQWTQKVKIPEQYVLMSEPDHIFLRPMPNFMKGNNPAAFPFFYIEPSKAENIHITKKFTGPITQKQLEEIAPVGNSPTFMTFDDMKRVMPTWMNVSIAVFKDQEANSVWGWVQEMYGFTIAAWLNGIKHVDLFLHMMAQPPWDQEMTMANGKPFYILHYTYGMDYKLTGEFTPGKFGEWRFDKRTYGSRPPPRHLGDPPKNMHNDLVRALINSINEATAALPCWDSYAESGKADYTCDEMKSLTDPRFKQDGKAII
ncbi:hypothetical protein HYH03_000310 [Edaphochlamys debaryana]|uniref:Apple domain-containing protein n=1 Tax=Edaphochlamys debaryana TaxID=47281 RepID=A0A835YFD8_9CHLO|nr:hypothetical protein HYH03_000310 [Edaphochlamys debaryana]|eukprot:KAG2501810.1 hypothetical protein HYH03_000310 [Edaphochlamys debaryana]